MKFLLIFLIAFVLMTVRRPELILNAQFWAEDGRIWYADAYNNGWLSSLLLPQNGYYQTISKLTASISLAFPIIYAPIIFNIIGISVRCCAVAFILSERLNNTPTFPRLIAASVIIFLPEAWEVYGNVTNAHWYLAIYLLFVFSAKETQSKLWKLHDYTVLIVAGLSGPFVVFMAPAVLFKYIIENGLKLKKITKFEFLFITLCLIQTVSILSTFDGTRTAAPLGASLETLINIISSRVYLSAFDSAYGTSGIWSLPMISIITFVIGTTIMVFAIVKANTSVKMAIVFTFFMIFFALLKPMMSDHEAQWPKLQYSGGRYFVVPAVFVAYIIASVIYLFHKPLRWVLCGLMVMFLIIGYYKNFQIPNLVDYSWKESAKKIELARPGENVRVPINPRWDMRIIKK